MTEFSAVPAYNPKHRPTTTRPLRDDLLGRTATQETSRQSATSLHRGRIVALPTVVDDTGSRSLLFRITVVFGDLQVGDHLTVAQFLFVFTILEVSTNGGYG